MSTAILPTVTCRRCHQPINLGPQVRIDNDGRPIHERCFLDQMVEEKNRKLKAA